MTKNGAPIARQEWVVCFIGRRAFQVEVEPSFDDAKIWATILDAHRVECSGCPQDRLCIRRLGENATP